MQETPQPGNMSFKGIPHVTCHFKGNKITGIIVSSTNMLPHYHWFCFDDAEMVEKLGDSIAFKEVNGWLEPVAIYTRHADLVNALKDCISEHLQQQANIAATDTLRSSSSNAE
jgi:pyruvate/oxaloacetate carboxyltransferase